MTDLVSLPPFGQTPVSILLASFVAVMDKLPRRGQTRTRNSPLGDSAGSLALRAYGRVVAPNSEMGYDLMTPDRRSTQVKAYTVDVTDKRTQNFSALRS